MFQTLIQLAWLAHTWMRGLPLVVEINYKKTFFSAADEAAGCYTGGETPHSCRMSSTEKEIPASTVLARGAIHTMDPFQGQYRIN
jgi:hypothetical protein